MADTNTQHIAGFRLSGQSLSNSRSTWEHWAANPTEAANVRVSPEMVREQLLVYSRFEGQRYDRVVSSQLQVFEYRNLEWRFTKGGAVPKGELVQITAYDVGAQIDQMLAGSQPRVDPEVVSVRLPDGTVVRGQLVQEGPLPKQSKPQIVPLDHAEVEYQKLDDGKDYFFGGRIKPPTSAQPLAFVVVTEVRFNDELVERKITRFSPVFQRTQGASPVPRAFAHFNISEPSREFLLGKTEVESR